MKQAGDEHRRWDERYASEPWFFGEAPNAYLVEVVERLFWGRGGTALCLGEGEGRDALYLARRGFRVTAVDASRAGLAKLRARAEAEELCVRAVHADLAEYLPAAQAFDLVSAFYCHLPPATRRAVHGRAARALRRPGYLVIEGFTPRQRELGLSSGGPKDPALLFTPEALREDFANGAARVLALHELAVELDCGRHRGAARVVRLLAATDKEETSCISNRGS